MDGLSLLLLCVGFHMLREKFIFSLLSNRPSFDVPEGRLPPAKPGGVQGPGEGKEECGSEWDRPAGERTTQDRERGV